MRNSGFQNRSDRQAGGAGKQDASFFGKRQRNESFGAKAEMNVPNVADHLAAIRRRQFSRLIESAKTGPIRLSEMLEMQESRVKALSDGSNTIDPMLAYHIEEMAGLPHGWIENGTLPRIPDDVMVKLTADIFVPQNDIESVFGVEEAPAAPNVFEAEVLSAAVMESSSPDVSATPSVVIKKPRRVPVDAASADLPRPETDPAKVFAQEAPVGTPPSFSPASKSSSVAEIARQNLVSAMAFFPSLRQYLTQKTDLSPSSISGALTGSRALPLSNISLFESILGLPLGWLRSSRSADELRTFLVASLGEAVVFAPAPKRGRKSADKTDVAVTPLAKTREAPVALPLPPGVGKKDSQSIEPAPESKQEVPAGHAVSATSVMLEALIDVLRQGVSSGVIGMPDIASTMNHVFERQRKA